MVPTPGSDPVRTRELLAGYLQGELEAERTLFERHRRALIGRARSHRLMSALASRTSPEDLADECILRVLEGGALREFEARGIGSLHRFLSTVLDRVMLDALRAQSVAKRPAESAQQHEAPEVSGGREASPTSTARADELLDLCQRCLSPGDWDLWRLTEVEGLTSNEVSAQVGSTAAAVRSRLRHIRVRLLRELARESGSP